MRLIGLCLIKIVLYVSHNARMSLDHIYEFSYLLILLLQVISQGFIVLKQIFVLLIQGFKLSSCLCKV